MDQLHRYDPNDLGERITNLEHDLELLNKSLNDRPRAFKSSSLYENYRSMHILLIYAVKADIKFVKEYLAFINYKQRK